MNEIAISGSNEIEITTRLVVAVIIGGIIGWNRQRLGKPAGLRTHMLVCLGSALIVMIPFQLSNPPSPDAVSRTIQEKGARPLLYPLLRERVRVRANPKFVLKFSNIEF